MYDMHCSVETECVDFLYIDVDDFGPSERLSEIFRTQKYNVTKMLFVYSKDFWEFMASPIQCLTEKKTLSTS